VDFTLPFAIELAFLGIAFNVGIVAQPLVVLDVFVGDDAKQLLHLLLREFAVGIGLQIGQGKRCQARSPKQVRRIDPARMPADWQTERRALGSRASPSLSHEQTLRS
jgi:hypothetical protein